MALSRPLEVLFLYSDTARSYYTASPHRVWIREEGAICIGEGRKNGIGAGLR